MREVLLDRGDLTLGISEGRRDRLSLIGQETRNRIFGAGAQRYENLFWWLKMGERIDAVRLLRQD